MHAGMHAFMYVHMHIAYVHVCIYVIIINQQLPWHTSLVKCKISQRHNVARHGNQLEDQHCAGNQPTSK